MRWEIMPSPNSSIQISTVLALSSNQDWICDIHVTGEKVFISVLSSKPFHKPEIHFKANISCKKQHKLKLFLPTIWDGESHFHLSQNFLFPFPENLHSPFPTPFSFPPLANLPLSAPPLRYSSLCYPWQPLPGKSLDKLCGASCQAQLQMGNSPCIIFCPTSVPYFLFRAFCSPCTFMNSLLPTYKPINILSAPLSGIFIIYLLHLYSILHKGDLKQLTSFSPQQHHKIG